MISNLKPKQGCDFLRKFLMVCDPCDHFLDLVDIRRWVRHFLIVRLTRLLDGSRRPPDDHI
jgi:hypothetical protein